MFRHLKNRMDSDTPDASGGAIVDGLPENDPDAITDTGSEPDSDTDDDTLGNDPEIIEIIAEADDMSEDAQDDGVAAERWTALQNVVRQYGASEALVDFSTRIGLFNTVSNGVALESMQGTPEQKLSEMLTASLEGLKERAAEASAKISERMEQILRKISDVSKEYKDKAVALAKSGKEYTAEHPYKVAAISVAALSAVVGIVSFATGRLTIGNFSRDSLAEMMKRFTEMCKKVKLPNTRVDASVTPGEIPKLTYNPTKDPFDGKLGNGPYFTRSQFQSSTGDFSASAMKDAAEMDNIASKLSAALKAFGKAAKTVFEDVRNPARPMRDLAQDTIKQIKGNNEPTSATGGIFLRVAVTIGIWTAITSLISRSIVGIAEFSRQKVVSAINPNQDGKKD